MPDAVKEEAIKELNRFTRINPMSPEHTVARTYLEWLIALPWNVSSGEAVNVQRAAEILDEDHYDLEKVKNRILDFLAVMQLKPKLKGPILCFVGPPAWERLRSGAPSRARWAASSSAFRSAGCMTKPRSAAIGALTSGRCRAR